MAGAYSPKQVIGLVLLLLGVSSFAVGLVQLNTYFATKNLADSVTAATLQKYADLKNDPAKLTALGLSTTDLSQVDALLTQTLSEQTQLITLQANSVVTMMAADFVLALLLLPAGGYLLSGK